MFNPFNHCMHVRVKSVLFYSNIVILKTAITKKVVAPLLHTIKYLDINPLSHKEETFSAPQEQLQL